MTATKYAKSVSTDFTSLLTTYPDIDSFELAVRHSSIVVALDYSKRTGDTFDTWFKDELSAGEQTTFSSLVTAHTGVSTAQEEQRTSEGKLLVQPDIFNLSTFMCISGVSDKHSDGTRFGGDDLKVECTETGETSFLMELIEWIGMTGARGIYNNAKFGDYIGFEAVIETQPSGVITSNDSTGAYEKQALGGGLSRFITEDDGDTRWDLDTTSKLNAFVGFTKAIPGPAAIKNSGYFDYDKDTNTLTHNSTGTGKYDIYDNALPTNKIGVKVWLIGNDKELCMSPQSVRSRLVLPHWKIKVIICDAAYDSQYPLQFALNLVAGREKMT